MNCTPEGAEDDDDDANDDDEGSPQGKMKWNGGLDFENQTHVERIGGTKHLMLKKCPKS